MVQTSSARDRRRRRVRKLIKARGGGRPRLSVFRSHAYIYAQIIDDDKGETLVAASSLEKALRTSLEGTGDKAAAAAVGKPVAERAKDKGVNEVVFDRGGYIYHGRVKALADAAREAGLKF